MTFEKKIIFNGRTKLAELVLDQSWTVAVQKKSDNNQLVFFVKKKRIFFILIK